MKKIKKINSTTVRLIISHLVCVIVSAFITLSVFLVKENRYTVSAAVVDIQDSFVYFETGTGLVYSIETDQLYQIGELYFITFDGNGTCTPLDDIITQVNRPIN